MKQFNLEEYIKNPSKKIVTRDGHKVTRFLCTNVKNIYPIIAAIEVTNNTEIVKIYTKEGTYFEDKTKHPSDLFFASEKHEGWINVYRNGEHLWCGDIKRTEAEAKEFEDSKFYITSIKIEWEE